MPPRKKKRRHGKPQKAVRVTTYQRLEEYLRAFAAGHFHLVILVGAGGLGKSRSVRSVLGGTCCWNEGNATPFGMYVKLYRHRDQYVVIDDVDALYADVAVHTLESLKTRGFSTFDIRKTPILRLSDPPGPLVLQGPDL
jgi:hypothetical protein